MKLSIIIVNYNTFHMTKNTITSVISSIQTAIDYEIIVVDNKSTLNVIQSLKNHFKSYKHITFIENDYNAGFSIANNIGINASTGDYVLLLNSDTLVQEGCIASCLQYIYTDPTIGALGCKLLLADGSLDHACKRGFPTPEASLYYFLKLHKLFPNSRRFGQYTLSHQSIDEINEVDSLTGAFMLLPRHIIDEIGMLDEDFFMYGEDLDWCYRIKEAGYKILYYPKATTIHLKGQSSKKKRKKTIYEFHRAMILFYNKHYKNSYPLVVSWLLYASIWLRMCFTYVINFFKKS